MRPYDVTSWSLPLHRGLKSYEIKSRDTDFESRLKPMTDAYNPLKGNYKLPAIFPVTSNGSFKAAFIAMQNGLKVSRLENEAIINGKTFGKGSFVIQGNNEDLLNNIVKESLTEPGFIDDPDKLEITAVKMPRIALVETYFSDMDAGWTRFLFDTYKLPYTVIHPDEFEKTDFVKNYDIVIFPDVRKNLLMTGKPGTETRPSMSNYPPEYLKGMDKKGLEKLMLFVNGGGKVISWGQSTDLFTGMLEITIDKEKQEFMLPFSNEADQAQKEGLVVPGSLVRMKLKKDSPLTLGMPEEIGAFYRGNPLFNTTVPRFDMDRRVIGSFAKKDILMSGYSEKEQLMSEKPAMIWLKKGKGELILYSFSPQFRASTPATYKLLFNALFSTMAE
jgi:hypothetical protein